jgi:hypothetical protein
MLYIAHIHNNVQQDRLLIDTYYSDDTKHLYLGIVLSREISGIEKSNTNTFFCLTNKNRVHLTFTINSQCSKIHMTSSWDVNYFYPITGKNLQLFTQCLYMDFKYIVLSYLGFTNKHTRKNLLDKLL